MRKNLMVCTIIGALSAVLLVGCGYDDKSLDVTKINVDNYVSELATYSNLAIETEAQMEVTDETVQSYIDYALSGLTSYEEVDRPIQNGDIANIDYEGIKDGVAFDGGTAQGYDLEIGSGNFIPGFEDGLIGYSTGDEVALELTFPEQYHSEELAGQAVIFNVKINSVSEKIAPEVTDEMVATFAIPGVTNEEQFRAYIRENLEESAKLNYESGLRDKVMTELYENTAFNDKELPEGLLNFYISQIKKEDTQMATQNGYTLEQFVTMAYGTSYEEYEAQVKEQAQILVKDALICAKIARDNNITVTDDEVKAELESEEYAQDINEEDFRNYLLERKVVEFLLESATVTEK